MQEDKKRQHYVWKKYLKPWTVDGRIWCKRGDSLFNTSPENVAQEKFFYYAEPLNDAEFAVVQGVISRAHPTARATLKRNLDLYRAASETTEHSRRNYIEDYHSLVENGAKDCLDSLGQKDRSFLQDTTKKAQFCYFVGLQQMRTKKTFESAVAALRGTHAPAELGGELDFARMEPVFSLIFADVVGNWIHSKGRFVFLECQAGGEFITCDQPVFNIHSRTDQLAPVLKFELLYPISPVVAVLITDNESENDRTIDVVECSRLNHRIYLESHELLFARQRESLSQFGQTVAG